MKYIKCEYIRADKSIEWYEINQKCIIILNSQGLYFDVFFSRDKLRSFLNDEILRGDLFFDCESKLDNFLTKLC